MSDVREPGKNRQHQLANTVGLPMCQALVEYDQGNYGKTVELLKPLRYRFTDIGGSDAQVGSFRYVSYTVNEPFYSEVI